MASMEDGEDFEESCDNEAERSPHFDSIEIKEELLSPEMIAGDSVSSEDVDSELLEETISKKDEEKSMDNVKEDSSISKKFYIKQEPEVESACTVKEEYEVIRKSSSKDSKKCCKRTCYNFSTDCTEVLPRKKQKKKNSCEVDQLMQSAMEGLQILQNHLTKPAEDHIELFMHYVASELREIKSSVLQLEAKQAIFNVVYDIRRRDLE